MNAAQEVATNIISVEEAEKNFKEKLGFDFEYDGTY